VVAETDPAAAWMTGLRTAGMQVLQWAVLVIVLAEVTMFNGRAPQIARNLQIAIWTSVPLALMAAVQLVYLANGGSIGEPGVTGFLAEWDTFAESDPYIRNFMYGVASQLTFFWLWSLALIYIAARKTLHGKRTVVILVIALWVVILGIGSGYPYYKDITDGKTQPPTEEVMPSEQQDMGDVSTCEMPAPIVPMEPDSRIEQRRQP
jgi:hypothetical protein